MEYIYYPHTLTGHCLVFIFICAGSVSGMGKLAMPYSSYLSEHDVHGASAHGLDGGHACACGFSLSSQTCACEDEGSTDLTALSESQLSTHHSSPGLHRGGWRERQMVARPDISQFGRRDECRDWGSKQVRLLDSPTVMPTIQCRIPHTVEGSLKFPSK
ncbi:hypothetical protein AcV7_010399 [Taiwanofungus camphoratus]|nr:hypothetical protein AcV7_010419 [Antrodia cinnamomea]KAI0929769.1 hypothetical protein AcV7_010399 [Antrodia cinnamomea]